MRRVDRQITGEDEIRCFLDRSKVLRIGTSDADGMYIVPVNFCYEYKENKLTFYFHSAVEGRKVRAFAANSKVCVEIDGDHEPVKANTACAHSFRYSSLIGNGSISLVENGDRKLQVMKNLLSRFTEKQFDTFPVQNVNVYRIDVEYFTVKMNK